MLPTPQHTKIKTQRTRVDGTVEIDSHSTFKQLSSVKQEIERSFPTSRDSLAADLIKHSSLLREHETTELNMRITTNKATGDPEFIICTWTVNKEYYGR